MSCSLFLNKVFFYFIHNILSVDVRTSSELSVCVQRDVICSNQPEQHKPTNIVRCLQIMYTMLGFTRAVMVSVVYAEHMVQLKSFEQITCIQLQYAIR